jgi:hypothetical protein
VVGVPFDRHSYRRRRFADHIRMRFVISDLTDENRAKGKRSTANGSVISVNSV